MDNFSNSVLKYVLNHFPEFKNKYNHDSKFLELDISSINNSNLGGLIIQTTVEKDIWIRNYYKYSGYLADTKEELVIIMKELFVDNILWVIGFKNDKWVETTLIKKGVDIETEKGITYNILSWSGNCDNTFTVV